MSEAEHNNNNKRDNHDDDEGHLTSSASENLQNASPNKKAKVVESYMRFRGRKVSRVGAEFQATALPRPDPSHYSPQKGHTTSTPENDENRVPLEDA